LANNLVVQLDRNVTNVFQSRESMTPS